MSTSSEYLPQGNVEDQRKEILRCVLLEQGARVQQLLARDMGLRVEQVAEIKAFVRNANTLSAGLRQKAITTLPTGQDYDIGLEDALRSQLEPIRKEIDCRFYPFWEALRFSREESSSPKPDIQWEQLAKEVVALWDVMEKVYDAVKAELNLSITSPKSSRRPLLSPKLSVNSLTLSGKRSGKDEAVPTVPAARPVPFKHHPDFISSQGAVPASDSISRKDISHAPSSSWISRIWSCLPHSLKPRLSLLLKGRPCHRSRLK